MESKLTIVLSDKEREALQAVSVQELRDLRDQARFFLREALRVRGVLCSDQVGGTQSGGVGLCQN